MKHIIMVAQITFDIDYTFFQRIYFYHLSQALALTVIVKLSQIGFVYVFKLKIFTCRLTKLIKDIFIESFDLSKKRIERCDKFRFLNTYHYCNEKL